MSDVFCARLFECSLSGLRVAAGKKFDVDLESATSVDWQSLRVQENVQGHSETGRMPRTIEGYDA